MTAQFDRIGHLYRRINDSPKKRYVDAYTYFQLLGELAGRSILDLACGEGFFSRQFRRRGAARVVGVDVSGKMIELANRNETSKPLGIEYVVSDVLELKKIGTFDLVAASYLLNFAETKDQLERMCHVIFENLKPGGRFVSLNNNLEQPPETYAKCEKYGLSKSISGRLQEGSPITLKYRVNGHHFSFDNYYLSEETYDAALRSIGFREICWHKPMVCPEALRRFGKAFWQDLLDHPPIVGIECVK